MAYIACLALVDIDISFYSTRTHTATLYFTEKKRQYRRHQLHFVR